MELLTLSGRVVRGEGLGRKLGWPTANIKTKLPPRKLPRGVFKVAVSGRALRSERLGACNVGTRPTVSGARRLCVEVHIPGFQGSLYGRTLRLRFLKKLRAERRFASFKALKAQIRKDVASLKV